MTRNVAWAGFSAVAVASLGLGGCGGQTDGRSGAGANVGGTPPVTFIEEGDYQPIAQYLVSNKGNGAQNDAGDSDDDDAAKTCDGFSCKDGTCIPADWKCDQLDDCSEKEDESDCPASSDGGGTDSGDADDGGNADGDGNADGGGMCDGFACNDGTCIIEAWKCDGLSDCSSGEDETGCPSNDGGNDGGSNDGGGNDDGGNDGGGGTCDGFSCNDGTCIETSWKCDQIQDCTAGEDEAGCSDDGGGNDGDGGDDGGSNTCAGFTCNDGACIDASWQCDAEADCADGEDEAACAVSTPLPAVELIPSANPSRGAIECIINWSAAGIVPGIAAGAALAKACQGAGILVGVLSYGGGFGAAAVCFAADTIQVDAVIGGVVGAVGGLVGGISECEGDAVAEAGQALQSLLSNSTVPTFEVKSKPATDSKVCGVPTDVQRTGSDNQCTMMHDDLKEFESLNAQKCAIDIGNIGNDAAAVTAACTEIRKTFANAIEAADRRYAFGKACYKNGNQGPMGNSDYGHQVAWCSHRRAANNCVKQARDPKLNCNLTDLMNSHAEPSGCENLLACTP